MGSLRSHLGHELHGLLLLLDRWLSQGRLLGGILSCWCCGCCLVDKLCLVFSIQVLSELVLLLDSIPLVVPVIDAEAGVVAHAIDEEIAACDGIVDREACHMPKSVRVRWQLCAFHEDRTNVWMSCQRVLAFLHHTRRHLGNINLLAKSNCFKTRHILAANNDIAVLVGVNATLILDERLHRLQTLSIGSEDGNLLFEGVATSDRRKVGKG
mmetsp:Transcript_38297/g.89968  ORF Transcript_38297/g.89968 Transcript_38297/m.89968 type:complete len:211 (-) Transcript_38297:633-1265(-)